MVTATNKLDIGCGRNKMPGYIGVDNLDLPCVDVKMDVTKDIWPWEESSIEEINASHFIEHLTNFDGKFERVAFFNNAWKVLKPGGKLILTIPHWSSNRYYGDPTHKEVISEFSFWYLDKNWRGENAPHTDARWAEGLYECDFVGCTWNYNYHPSMHVRSPDYIGFAQTYWLEARQDMVVTCVARKETS